MRNLLFAIAFSLCAPIVASADVVGPEPSSCPPGSTPATSHSGPYCRPAEQCTMDSACGEGSACTDVMQCVETRGCGGQELPDAEPCTLQHIVGPCGSGDSCDVGVCMARSVCVDPDDVDDTDGGCGCHAIGARSSGGAAILFVLAIGALVAMRRR